MQNEVTQNINLTVQETELTAPGTPDTAGGDEANETITTANTGFLRSFQDGGTVLSSSAGAVLLGIIVAAVVWKKIKKSLQAKEQKDRLFKRDKITKEHRALKYLPVLAGATVFSLVVVVFPGKADTAPNITVDNENLNLTVTAGETVATTSTVTVGPALSYELFAVTDAPEGVTVTLNGETVSTDPYEATLLKTSDSETTSNDSTTFELVVTADKNANTGIQSFGITYSVIPETVPTTMAQMTADFCSTLPIGDDSIMPLTDERDGTIYRIRRMEDGKCWMIDNLALELGNPANPLTTILTPATSDVATNTPVDLTNNGATTDTLIGSNGIFTNPDLQYTNGSGVYLTDNGNRPAAWGIGNGGFDAWRQVNPVGGIATNGATIITAGTPGIDFGDGSTTGYGYLYNWYTATASTGNQNVTTTGEEATGSICPKSWKLPTGYGDYSVAYTNKDFGFLNAAMFDVSNPGVGTTVSNHENQAHAGNWQPNGFWQGAYSGSYSFSLSSQGRITAEGWNGGSYYWGSTSGGSNRAGGLYFDHSLILSDSDSDRHYGYAVRCLVRD